MNTKLKNDSHHLGLNERLLCLVLFKVVFPKFDDTVFHHLTSTLSLQALVVCCLCRSPGVFNICYIT